MNSASGKLKKHYDYLDSSGETMYGIDRLKGGSINTTTAGKEFWSIMDGAKASSNWDYNYKGGSFAPRLKKLAGEIMYPQYQKNSNNFLSEKARKIVDANDALTFHFAYGSWNGPGWFESFAKDINDAVAKGVTDPKKLQKVATESRTRAKLHDNSTPSKLISQQATKIDDLMNELNSAILNPIATITKNPGKAFGALFAVLAFGSGLFLLLKK